MKRLLTLAVCFLMAATVLTGCSSGSSEGVLKVGVGGDTAFLDPAVVDDSITANILAQVYEGLYKLDSEGNPQPMLAEGMPTISDDKLTYTIKLKSGVNWSDGTPLKAADFVYAWKRAASMGGAVSYYSMFITNYIKDAKDGAKMDELKNFGAVAKDDSTIVITLKEKCPYFTSLLTNTVFYPVREDFIKAQGGEETASLWADSTEAPVLSAFKYTSINTKDEIALTKNDAYYDADKVKLAGISFKVMADMDSETSAFQSGELDFATSINREAANGNEELKKQIYTIDPFVCNYYILINSGEENNGSTPGLTALKDKEIRKALSMGIDRADILKVLNYGDTAYELYGLVPKGIPGAEKDYREEADEKEKLATTNVEEAKKIMEAKGYSDSNMLNLTYKYNDNTMHKDVAQSMQASLKKIHVNLELVATEKEAFFDARDKGDFELARHAMTADFIDPMAYFSMYIGFDAAGNTVDDATYEKMVAEANKEDDAKARMNKLHDAEKYLIQENNYLIPLFGYTEPFLLNEKVKGITSSPEGHYDLRFASFE